MLIMKPYFICWLFLIAHHAIGQGSILKLNGSQPYNVIRNANCSCCLVNDVDYFTVKGIVNKNGSNPQAHTDTNLYLQARAASNPNGWASQCRPDLTVCGPNLNTDCYCESQDANGDYHIVMTIMAKSIYSGGQLMLSWNDQRSPHNPPMLGDPVDYYRGNIIEPFDAKLDIGNKSIQIDTDPRTEKCKDFQLNYEPNMKNASFCVHNLGAIDFIQITAGMRTERTTTDQCVFIQLPQSEIFELTLEFAESGGCERKCKYIARVGPAECVPGLECYEIALIVIFAVMLPFFLIILLIILCCCCTKESKDDPPPCSKCDNARDTKPQNVKTALYLIVIIIVLLLVSLIGAILVLVLIFSVGPSTCGTGLQPCEIALIVVFVGLIPLILIIVLIVLICCCPKAWDACTRRVCPQDGE